MTQKQSIKRNTNNNLSHFLFLSIILLTFTSKIQTKSNTYTNPAISNNCPDPGVISYLNEKNSIEYVAVVTSNDNTDAFPMYTSSDLINWTFLNYVFPRGSPNFPQWAVSDFWAPEIHRINETQWNLYFAARNGEGNLCVGVAYSNSPLGPFLPTSLPLIALNNIPMGAIDPTYFIWGNKRYVIWKEDGNAVGKPTPININQLSDDGLFLSNLTATQLITNDQPWEGAVTEAPWMIRQNGFFYLFYSGNAYNTPDYAVGVARSTNLFGPFEKYPNPIVHTSNETAEWQGPGHCSVLCPATQQSPISELTQCYMIYHSWQYQNIGGDYPRMMLVDHIQWMNDDGVVVDQTDCSVSSPCWPFIANFSPSQSPVPFPY